MAEKPDLRALRAASKRAAAHRVPRPPAPDLTRPLVPESFTQLYHTPCYGWLSDRQRLRYNQLYGLRCNELFMSFERGFTCRAVVRLGARCRAAGDTELADCLALMLREEARHHAMFIDFNRRYLPALYRHGGRLAPTTTLEDRLMALLVAATPLWPALVWLILVLEEFSTAFSRLLVESATDRPGGLETSYVDIHRRHLLDESRHVQLDGYLVERLLGSGEGLRQRGNAWLFRRLLAEILIPKRSGAMVIRHLAREHPELRPAAPAMIAAVRALGRDPGLAAIIDDPQQMPITHGLLAHYPSFRWSGCGVPVEVSTQSRAG